MQLSSDSSRPPQPVLGSERQKADGVSGDTRETVKKVVDQLETLMAEVRDSAARSRRLKDWCAETDGLIVATQRNTTSNTDSPRLLPDVVTQDAAATERSDAASRRDDHPANNLAAQTLEARHAALVSQHSAMERKMKQLALNLVRTLRERNELDEKAARLTDVVVRLTDELRSTQERTQLLQDALAERDVALTEVHTLRETADQRAQEIAMLKREIRQRTSAFQKLAVDAHEKQLSLYNEKEAVTAQITKQMMDLVAEHESVVNANDEMYFACEKAAADLRAALRRGMDLERRAEAAERAAEAERQALLAFVSATDSPQVQVTNTSTEPLTAGSQPPSAAVAATTSAAPSGGPQGTAMNSLTLQQQVIRLEARIRAQGAAADAAARRAEERISALSDAKDVCESRLTEFEAMTRSLKRELAASARDATVHQLAAQQARQRLDELKEEARFVTSLMLVTRAEVEHIYTVCERDVEVQQFVDRVAMDLINCSKFLSRVRSIEINSAILAPQMPRTVALSKEGYDAPSDAAKPSRTLFAPDLDVEAPNRAVNPGQTAAGSSTLSLLDAYVATRRVDPASRNLTAPATSPR